MIELKTSWWRDMDDYLVPILTLDSYWIWDTKLNQFVCTAFSNKSVWSKTWSAKNAFNNATWIKIADQTRYKVIKIQ